MSFSGWFWLLAIPAALALCIVDRFEMLARVARAVAGGFGHKATNANASGRPVNDFGRAANAARFVTAAAGFLWRWKVPLLAVALFVVIAGTIGSCVPFDFAKSKDTLRAERDAALIDKTVAHHETNVAARATELAEATHRDRARVREVIAAANEELDHAVSQADFDLLHRAYERGYCGVFDDTGCAGLPDPAPAGIEPLRGPGASPV